MKKAHFIRIVVVGGICFISSLLQISFVWGSGIFFFSGICLIAPLLGMLGVGVAAGVLCVKKIAIMLFTGKFLLTTTGIPTLAAAWCWSLAISTKKNRFTGLFVNVFVPIICMFLFVLHPSVGAGWWYSLYWIIPIGLYSISSICNNLFIVALRSTFVAHALGSVIWCYVIPMKPAQWLALIPFVAVERLVFAAGMVMIYVGVCKINNVVIASKNEKSLFVGEH